MDKFIRLILMAGAIIMALGAPVAAFAQSPWPPFCQEGSLPSHDPQYPADQLTLICIPPNWNGQLVMYAHGYMPEQLPLTLPYEELSRSEGMLEAVLGEGFAFATTSYHKNGYAVEQARQDLNDLLNYFKKQVKPGSLQKVFVVGASEGGEVAALMIEHFPDKYAGALAMCGPIGGGQYQVQYLSDFRAAFDYYFPNVFPFGVVDVPPTAFLNWGNDTSAIAQAIMGNPLVAAQLLASTGAAVDPNDPTTAVATAVGILYYSIWGTNDLIETAGGMPYDNQATIYLDPGLNAGIERVQSDGRAVAYMRRFYQTTGQLQRPLVTLHNLYDPVVPYHHEEIYAGLAAQAGTSNLFIPLIAQQPYGHCKFTSQDIGAAFAVLTQQSSAQAGP